MKESEKNNLAYALSNELGKTTDKFLEEHPETGLSVTLGAGILYLAGFLTLAQTKERALEVLDCCVERMRSIIDITHDSFFDGGIRKHFNPNQK